MQNKYILEYFYLESKYEFHKRIYFIPQAGIACNQQNAKNHKDQLNQERKRILRGTPIWK